MTELDKLLRDLAQPGVPAELGVLAACLVLAFGVCWLAGRHQAKDSIWFGRAVVDGLLFPLLSLVLTYTARNVLDDYQAVPVLRIAVPVLVSLAGIRFLARVFTVAFPASGLARLVERLFSWLAWIAAVLWIAVTLFFATLQSILVAALYLFGTQGKVTLTSSLVYRRLNVSTVTDFFRDRKNGIKSSSRGST